MTKSKTQTLAAVRKELESRRGYQEYCRSAGWHDRAREWGDYIALLERDERILELELELERRI